MAFIRYWMRKELGSIHENNKQDRIFHNFSVDWRIKRSGAEFWRNCILAGFGCSRLFLRLSNQIQSPEPGDGRVQEAGTGLQGRNLVQKCLWRCRIRTVRLGPRMGRYAYKSRTGSDQILQSSFQWVQGPGLRLYNAPTLTGNNNTENRIRSSGNRRSNSRFWIPNRVPKAQTNVTEHTRLYIPYGLSPFSAPDRNPARGADRCRDIDTRTQAVPKFCRNRLYWK